MPVLLIILPEGRIKKAWLTGVDPFWPQVVFFCFFFVFCENQTRIKKTFASRHICMKQLGEQTLSRRTQQPSVIPLHICISVPERHDSFTKKKTPRPSEVSRRVCVVFSNTLKVSFQTNILRAIHHVRKLYHEIKVNKKKLKEKIQRHAALTGYRW